MKRRSRPCNSRDTTITRLNIAKVQQERAALLLEPLTVEELVLQFVTCHKKRHIYRAERLMKSH